MRRKTIASLAFLVGPSLVACGGNNADVPPALLDAVKNQGATSGYPEGPYGTHVDDTVQDLCFEGWNDPAAAGFDPERLERICLHDFHADASARLLLVESCTIWCQACRSEYGGSDNHQSLSDALAERRDRGFRILGTIFQDRDGKSAKPSDAAGWTKLFDVDFPFGVDPTHQLGLFTSPNVAPFNLLVDARTMKIVLALDGDEPATLFGKVDSYLAAAP